jgi:serine/threonine protein kinase
MNWTTTTPIGTVIDGQYLVRRVLARGSRSTVYEVEERGSGRAMALKHLRSSHPDEPGEDSSPSPPLPTLEHPNLVRIHGRGTWLGRPFVTMELLEGLTLSEWLRTAPDSRLSSLLAAGLFGRAALGLAALHAAGVAHGRFDPSRLVLTSGGTRLKIVGFGLPPKVEGDTASAPDHDIYSLGVGVYQTVTGRHPHAASGNQAGTEPPLPMHKVRSGVPGRMSRLVQYLLDPDRREGPNDCLEVARTLGEVARDLSL